MVWCSLFLSCDDADRVVVALRDSLQALGYAAFNPFGIMPGIAYPQAVRLFVSPVQAGWVRVIGEPDVAQLSALSITSLCLLAQLNGATAHIEAWEAGSVQPLSGALAPHLKPEKTLDDLERVLATPSLSVTTGTNDMDLFREVLPDAVKSNNVDMRQAQKMFDRLSAGLTQRSGNSGKEAEAHDLLHAERPDWNSAGGLQIRALMECLSVPSDWRTPDFVTLRDAYQLHERHRRKPDAMLYPGDDEAMAAVPDALDYTVVYGGKG